MKTGIRYVSLFAIAAVCSILLTAPPLFAQEYGGGPGGSFIANATAESPAAIESSTEVASATMEGLRLNFRGVPLNTVLNYMSKSAGFVIIREADVEGDVDVMSQQPLNDDEAVALLNTVLIQKGYTSIRNGRVLTIVSRSDAAKRDLPVRMGGDPEQIPKTDEMVTQIIPIRYASAAGLLDNLGPLIPSYATLSANGSSNALVLTDTQTNVRRIAEIVQALDTSISNISAVRVFPLQFADAKDLAEVINQVFKSDTAGSSRNNQGRRIDQFFSRMRGESSDSSGSSGGEARQAASRVVAVADEHTNSVVVCAPEDLMPNIAAVVQDIDTTGTSVTGVRVFHLRYADATETAQLITDVFKPDSSSSTSRRGRRVYGRGGAAPTTAQNNSERKTQENTVVAVADVRTNSVIVTASQTTLELVGQMISELDSNPARGKKVFVYKLENADPDGVATVLRGMFQGQGTSSGSGTSNSNRATSNRGASTGSRTGSSRTRGSSSSSGGGTRSSF